MQNFDIWVSLSGKLADLATALPSTHALKELLQEDSGEARKLLRWLNNLKGIDGGMEEWLAIGTAEEQTAKIKTIHQLMSIYAAQLQAAQKNAPGLLQDPAVTEANDAAAAMALAVAEHTLDILPEGHPDIETLEKLIPSLPKRASLRIAQSVQRLLSLLAGGMERSSGKPARGQSPVDRLVEMSNRIQATARRLRSIDTLEPPAREESIELAREILRKLKNMKFSDKPVKEMIDAGRPEEKAALAEELGEMADCYKNLLFEAAEINPNILQDARIKDANDAVNTFAHAVRLMAAKEIPVSAAATQQISADITQTPEEWQKLHDRAVDRLVKNMEGGVEKAAADIQEQQEQQQDNELAQEAAEAALTHSDRSRRKKRKRRSSHRSGGGGKKQQKQHRDMTADDYVLKQGRFTHDAQSARAHVQAPMPGLNAEAMAAIKQLGGALLTIGNQARDIGASLANVSATDKIAPDDKTVSQRVIEEQLKNPKGQGPRV